MLRNCQRFGAVALACFSSVVSAQQTPVPVVQTPPTAPAPEGAQAPQNAAPAPQTAPTTQSVQPVQTTEAATSQRASLAQCIKLALQRNLDVRSAGEDTSLAQAQVSAVKGQFGPRLNVDASYQHWNEAYVFGGFPVHDQNVFNVTATLTQPISGLFAIYDAYKVRDLGVDVAGVKLDAVKRQIALQVVQSYYRLLQAERLGEVAVASIEQLNGQLRLARSFHENGTVSQDDVLRAQLAVANAQQRRISVQARVTLERVHLAMLLGLPPNTPLEAEPIANDRPLTPESASLEQDEKTAETQRLELREIDRRIASSPTTTSASRTPSSRRRSTWSARTSTTKVRYSRKPMPHTSARSRAGTCGIGARPGAASRKRKRANVRRCSRA